MKIVPVKRYTVEGNSMLPTLKKGQDVLVWCWFYKQSLKTPFERLLSNFVYTPKIGDIVAFKQNGKEMIKRIQKHNGRSIFVIGDNDKESTDSRKFGWIDRKNIEGKIIWP